MAMILNTIFPTNATKMVTNVRVISPRTLKTCADHVQIISTEAVKPSSPTPQHLSTYKLSLADQMFSNLYMPLLFFYSAKHQNSGSVYDLLKQSLEKTITHYYPIAGRLIDGFSVHCNDRGVYLYKARVDVDVSEFLRQPQMELLQQLIPPNPQQFKSKVDERELLAIQVNFFPGGEMVIGICLSHAVVDGTAISNFMNLWGEITRGVNGNGSHRVSDFVVDCSSFFPPQNLTEDQYYKPPLLDDLLYTRFVFDGKKIAGFKEKVNQEIIVGSFNELQHATSFTIVSALIWGAAIAIARERNQNLSSHDLYYTFNLRNKLMNPPVLPQTFGNIFRFVKAEWSAGDAVDMEITGLVGEVIKAKRMADDLVNADYSAFMEEMNEATNDSRALSETCLKGLAFYEVDFGWGKPFWFAPGAIPMNDFVLLSGTSDGEGIEAWIGMTEEDIKKLEQNPSIRAYASCNPSINL